MLNWKVVCLTPGLRAGVSFVVCVACALVTPEGLHLPAALSENKK